MSNDQLLHPVRTLRGHRHDVMSLSFFQKDFVLSGDSKGTIKLWKIAEAEVKTEVNAHDGFSILGLASLGLESTKFLSQGRDGSVAQWDIRQDGSLQKLRTIAAGNGMGFCRLSVQSVKESVGSHLVALSRGERSENIGIFNSEGCMTAELDALSKSWGMCTSVQFVDEYTIASGHEDGQLRIWDLRMEKFIAEVKVAEEPLFTIAHHSRDDTLYCGGGGECISSWRLNGDIFIPLQSATISRPGVSQACFRADGRILIVASWDGKVRLYGSKPGRNGQVRPLGSLNFHQGTVHCCAAQVEGNLFVSGGTDKIVAIWNKFGGTAADGLG